MRESVRPGGWLLCLHTDEGSNVLQITPMSAVPRGGLLVTLQGRQSRSAFLMLGGGNEYDADMSIQVADRGPNARGRRGSQRARYRGAVPHRDARWRPAGGGGASFGEWGFTRGFAGVEAR